MAEQRAGRNDDGRILAHIEDLVAEEHQLQQAATLPQAERERLARIRVELDQSWDLLRQRRARREFGQDPGGASLRSPDIVERYEG